MHLNSKIYLLLIIFVGVYEVIAEKNAQDCGAIGDCLSSPIDCKEKCGCDRAYYYNETTGECVLDVRRLMNSLITRYDAQDEGKSSEEGMAKRIRLEADKLFKGVIISVIIFVTCAALCVFTACIYCVRMNYTDRMLKNDVSALAKKLQRDEKYKKSIVKTPRPPKEESCNVVVEEAGVFVV